MQFKAGYEIIKENDGGKDMKVTKHDKHEAMQRLKKWIKPGDTVYTVLRHVSQSGMMRHISLYVIKRNKPIFLDYSVSQLLECPQANTFRGGLKRSGCGMDMGFDLVYSLSWALFKDGYKIHHQWL